MKDWEDMVKEYKKQYDDEDGIHEFIDGLVPIYYGEIYSVYHEEIGTPLGIEIESQHVGLSIWQVMNIDIFNSYWESFHSAWTPFDDEEE